MNMKASLFGTLLLVIFLTVAGFLIAEKINENKETVEIEETTLAGDKSAADGLSVTYRAACSKLMHWETVYPLGREDNINSSFTYEKQSNDTLLVPDVQIGIHTNFGMSTSGSFDFSEGNFDQTFPLLPFLDVSERMSPGTTYSETVSLQDYYDFIPFSVSSYYTTTAALDAAGTYDENGNSLFNQFFRIPFANDTKVTVEITKEKDGSISALSMKTADDFSSEDIVFSSAVYDSNCFLAFPVRLSDGTLLDTSKMGGAYGIYTFAYDLDAANTNPYIIPKDIELTKLQIVTFCSFDPSMTSLEALVLNEEQDVLFALAKENGTYAVYCIRVSDGSILNRIDLSALTDPAATFSHFFITDNAVLLSMSDDVLIVLSAENATNYQVVLTADLAEIKNAIIAYLGENDSDAFDFVEYNISPVSTSSPETIAQYADTYQLIPAYSKNKLALYLYAYTSTLSFTHYLAIYSNDSLSYLGLYDYKGDHQVYTSYTTSVRPEEVSPVLLNWQKHNK